MAILGRPDRAGISQQALSSRALPYVQMSAISHWLRGSRHTYRE
jgi:hypothetical protein